VATSDWVVLVARLTVILAAGLAAIPLVNRSGRRRPTCVVMICGTLLTSIPAALQLLQTVFNWHLNASLSVLRGAQCV